MKTRILCLTVLAACISTSNATSQQANSVAEILKNLEIVDSGLLSVLPYLQVWRTMGETEIILQDNVAKGMHVYGDRSKAMASLNSASALHQAALPASAVPLIVNAYPAVGYQFAVRADAGRMLRAGLTIRDVMQQLGLPETVHERVISSDDREVKPISLREYSYAHGAVVFAVLSDSADQSSVEIAFLNVLAVAAAVLPGGER